MGEDEPVIRGDEEDVTFLLASLVDFSNTFISCGNTDNGSIVVTSVSHHIRRSEIIHDELKFLLLYTLAYLLSNTHSAHLWRLVICGNALVRWDEILLLVSRFKREDLLNSTVEEESDVSVLLSLSNVDLLDTLGAQGLSKDVTHVLRLETDLEGVVELVLSHRNESDVLWVGEIWQRRAVIISKELSDLAHTIGSVVEE